MGASQNQPADEVMCNGAGPYGSLTPCLLPAFCLGKNLSQTINIIREVEKMQKKRKTVQRD